MGFVIGCEAFLKTKGVFSAISHVQEAVLILLLFVQLPHRDAETRDKTVDTQLISYYNYHLVQKYSLLPGEKRYQISDNDLKINHQINP